MHACDLEFNKYNSSRLLERKILGSNRQIWLTFHGFRWYFSDYCPVLRRKFQPTLSSRQVVSQSNIFSATRLLYMEYCPQPFGWSICIYNMMHPKNTQESSLHG